MSDVFDVEDLLLRYLDRGRPGPGTLVRLDGLTGRDGYNPSGPIVNGGYPHTYVRAEPRNDEFATMAVPFRQVAYDTWERDDDLPHLPLQDPFTAHIHGEVVLGGVRILSPGSQWVTWETVFFRGATPTSLVEFARSPQGMKDVRLVELSSGRIGVFTRPRGGEAGRGKVGYTEIGGLDELSAEVMERAPLLPLQPVASQWWGVNAVYPLHCGYLGLLAHVARFDGEARRYYAVALVYDPGTGSVVQGPDVIADRNCFPDHPPKRADLADVVFPAWIERSRGDLYAGLSDSAIGRVTVGNPFHPFD